MRVCQKSETTPSCGWSVRFCLPARCLGRLQKPHTARKKILDKNPKHVAPRRFWFPQTVRNLLFWGGAEYNRFNTGSRTSQKCVCAKSRRRSHRVVGVFISVCQRDVLEDCRNRIPGPRNRTPGRNQKLGSKSRSLSWRDGIG